MESKDPVVAEGLALPFKNALAAAALVILATGVYLLAPHTQDALARLYGPPSIAFSGSRFLTVAAAIYTLVVAAYFLILREQHVSKSLHFFRVTAGWIRAPAQSLKRGLTEADRLAVLSTLLKSFFGPMMVMSLMAFCTSAWTNGMAITDAGLHGLSATALFNSFGYWFLLQVILFFDVFFFTVGYLVESRRLGNEIRSVDPTLVGWGAALLCYPPFNVVTSKLLGSTVSDFPRFDDPTVHLALNIALLVLMAIYASASAALGLKASNLTHRGIISRGPYAIVRHPAYTCKNIAWWIGSVPLTITGFQQSFVTGLMTAGSVVAWTFLYGLRALTEEDHLRKVDGEYAAYAAKVRYRFIPGVY
jgi:protein-S-isoprenylcysteine O-methyltransferase Ste14